jgi:parallel beta-helix repeat protein
MKRTILAIGIIFLLVGLNFSSISGIQINTQTIESSGRGNILYVGGSGEGNYTKIQDAIDDASNGDTVFVYDDSSPYIENLVINKMINLIGEDKNTTVIDGADSDDINVITITADCVILSGFTIRRADNPNLYGVQIDDADDIFITDNIIIDNFAGIYIFGNRNIVTKNRIKDNSRGIIITTCDYNQITHNIIQKNIVAIEIWWYSENTKIYNNHITNNNRGIDFQEYSNNNEIRSNNIYHNKINARFYWSYNNIWDSNYWGRPRNSPKVIFGLALILLYKYKDDWGYWQYVYFPVPMVNYDGHPANVPYDIPGFYYYQGCGIE